jgi:hypothetical protein
VVLLFDIGRWDGAMVEVEALMANMKESAAACCDLGIAAVVCFHRGETAMARRNLAAAVLPSHLIGNRVISPLALARSLDCEQRGALPAALAVLTAAFADTTQEIQVTDDLLADTVRLATKVGDSSTARAFADRAAVLATDSEIPHRLANALYCRGLVTRDATRLLAAAGRYRDASRPLLCAKALEAAAWTFADIDDRDQDQAALTRAVENLHLARRCCGRRPAPAIARPSLCVPQAGKLSARRPGHRRPWARDVADD